MMPSAQGLRAAAVVCLALAAWPAGANMAECRLMADDTERLACYDALAEAVFGQAAPAPQAGVTTPARVAPQPVPAPAAAPAAPAVSAAMLEAAFGAEQLSKDDRPAVIPNEKLEQLDSVATKVRRNALDKVTVWLANGQVWRQTDSYYFPVDDGEGLSVPVVIDRKLFSGYKLSPADSRRAISVKRIR